ncbi:MAG: urease accessory protein UreD, partial [Myxococcaceae bacterium]
ARGERWAFEALSSRISLSIGNERLLHDSMLLSSRHGSLPDRMGATELIATIVLAGDRLSALCDSLHAELTSAPLRSPSEHPLFVSSRRPWGLLVRASSPSIEEFHRALRQLLQPHVLALLGDDPLRRKW